MNKTEKQFIYFRESMLQSVLSDIATFGVLTGSFYVNYRFIGGNGLLYAVLLLATMFMVAGRASQKKITYSDKEKLIKDLQDGTL